jgi:hypothetical protein
MEVEHHRCRLEADAAGRGRCDADDENRRRAIWTPGAGLTIAFVALRSSERQRPRDRIVAEAVVRRRDGATVIAIVWPSEAVLKRGRLALGRRSDTCNPWRASCERDTKGS